MESMALYLLEMSPDVFYGEWSLISYLRKYLMYYNNDVFCFVSSLNGFFDADNRFLYCSFTYAIKNHSVGFFLFVRTF